MILDPDLITEDEFWDHYVPIAGPADSWLWTYDEIKNHDVTRIWTIVEGDASNHLYALPGWHLVNRLDYVLTEQSWEDDTKAAYYYFDIEEE